MILIFKLQTENPKFIVLKTTRLETDKFEIFIPIILTN